MFFQKFSKIEWIIILLVYIIGISYSYWQYSRLDDMNNQLVDNNNQLSKRIDVLQEVIFLQNIIIPDEVTFADSTYTLDAVTKGRLYHKIIELMSTKSKMVATNRRYKNFHFVKHLLVESNLSPDLFYLPMQESLLDKLAISGSGAKGLWQFMKSTGRRFGLTINWYIDERLDPEKSTRAAIKYVQYLMNKYQNNWPLLAAAYNNGESKLNRAIREGKSDNYFGLNLHPETEDYFLYVLAWKYIVEKKSEIFQQYGDKTNDYEISYAQVEILARSDLRVSKIISFFEGSYKIFDQLNPTVYRYVIPARRPVVLAVPKNQLDSLLIYFDKTRINYKPIESTTSNLSF